MRLKTLDPESKDGSDIATSPVTDYRGMFDSDDVSIEDRRSSEIVEAGRSKEFPK